MYVSDLHPGRLHPPARLVVPLEREGAPGAEREDVRAHRLELLVRHLDDLDPALVQQLEQPDRSEPRVDEREIVVERRDEAHQVHHLGAAVPVRQVVGEHPGVRESPRELLDAFGIRPVAATDQERLGVEPERVAAVDRPRPPDHAHDRNAGALEGGLQRKRLAEASVLARAEEHRARLADEHRVVGVDRVGVSALALGDDHLRARALEDLPESLVLGRRSVDVGLRRASRTPASAWRRPPGAGARARAGASRSSSGRRSRSWQPEGELSQPPVALDRRVVAVGGPLVAHPPGQVLVSRVA